MLNWFSQKGTAQDANEQPAVSATIKINFSTRVVTMILSIIAALLGLGSFVNIEENFLQNPEPKIKNQLKLESENLTNSN